MAVVTIPVGDGLTLVGDEWGDPANQPVLMLHGAGQNRHAWKNTAETLIDRGYFVLTVDARGHGDSDWCTQSKYNSEHSGRDTLALVDHLALQRQLLADADRLPPILIGASMGGMAALSAQHLRGGDLFRALVLVDIAPGFAFEGAARIINWMASNPDGFATLEDASDAMAAYNPHRPRPKELSGLTRVLRHGEDGRWRWRWDPNYILSKPGFAAGDAELMRSHMESMNDRLLNAARDVAAPLLLVRGGQSDLVTEAVAQEFVAQVPGAEYFDVQHTGHMVAGDDNDAFTAAVLDFLERTL